MEHEVTERLSVAGRVQGARVPSVCLPHGKRIETDRHGTEPRRRSGNIHHRDKGKDRRFPLRA